MKKCINIFKNRNIIYLSFPVLFWFLPMEWLENSTSICIYKNLTGHECLSCGMTRAIYQAIHFNFKIAYDYNHLIIIVLPLLMYVWVKKVIPIKGCPPTDDSIRKAFAKAGIELSPLFGDMGTSLAFLMDMY